MAINLERHLAHRRCSKRYKQHMALQLLCKHSGRTESPRHLFQARRPPSTSRIRGINLIIEGRSCGRRSEGQMNACETSSSYPFPAHPTLPMLASTCIHITLTYNHLSCYFDLPIRHYAISRYRDTAVR